MVLYLRRAILAYRKLGSLSSKNLLACVFILLPRSGELTLEKSTCALFALAYGMLECSCTMFGLRCTMYGLAAPYLSLAASCLGFLSSLLFRTQT